MSTQEKQKILEQMKGYTCTTLFLVPLLKIGQELKENGFINGYLGDKNAPVHYDDHLYLLFKPVNESQFARFYAEQSNKNPMLVDDYDIEGGLVMLIYKLDPKFNEDYKLFHDGKYSQFSDDFLAMHPKTIRTKDQYGQLIDVTTFQQKVFTKSKEIASMIEDELGIELEEHMEIWGIPDMEKEIFDLEKFRK